MTLADEVTLMGYLEDALEAEHGVRLILENPTDMRRLQQRLYRTKSEDKRYSVLTLSQHGSELWIVKKEPRPDAQS